MADCVAADALVEGVRVLAVQAGGQVAAPRRVNGAVWVSGALTVIGATCAATHVGHFKQWVHLIIILIIGRGTLL